VVCTIHTVLSVDQRQQNGKAISGITNSATPGVIFLHYIRFKPFSNIKKVSG
jgi:hypothetical protein